MRRNCLKRGQATLTGRRHKNTVKEHFAAHGTFLTTKDHKSGSVQRLLVVSALKSIKY